MISDPATIERLRANPNALQWYDKILLFGGGTLSFRKGATPAEHSTTGRDYVVKGGRPRGTVRKVALAMIAGEYPGKTVADVAAEEKLDDQSLKNTLWRIKNEWREKPRKKQTRRTAA